MKKIAAIIAVSMMLLSITGCVSTGTQAPSGQESNAISPLPGVVSGSEPAESTEPANDTEPGPLDGLTENKYEGLEVTAEILQRNAVVPGMNIPVTVFIKNTGDKEVIYALGSGSFKTPVALSTEVDGLQLVIPKDRLGIMTADYATRILMPGEELSFIINVMAVEPNENFDRYTMEMFGKEQAYIAEMPIDELQAQYSDIVFAEPGKYEGNVYFSYYAADDNAEAVMMPSANSFAKAGFTISIN